MTFQRLLYDNEMKRKKLCQSTFYWSARKV